METKEYTIKTNQTFITIPEGSKFIIIPTPENDPTGEGMLYGAYVFVKMRDIAPNAEHNAVCLKDGEMMKFPHDMPVIQIVD